jgi:hypothetical protein
LYLLMRAWNNIKIELVNALRRELNACKAICVRRCSSL